jgi:predicted TIM-barrel fold metal-dependent hydrolase
MIIDAHCHVSDETWYPPWFWDSLNTFVAPRYGLSYEQNLELRRKSWDPSGDTMVRSMDGAGVDKAITCVGDHGLVREDTVTPIEEVNRLTAEMVKRHPGRLYFAVGVDPRRKNALLIVETAVKEGGATSLKLHPATGWYPNDRMVYPLYEKCIELGIPVNFHTGPMYYPLRSKYSHPMNLDDVAVDFPELTIHCTHAGDVFFMDMVGIAKVRRNIVLDLAAWQRWLRTSRHTALSFYKTMRFIMDMVGPRLLFASDWSGFPDPGPYRDWVKAFTEIPVWVKEAGVEFTQEELDGYLGGNALRWLLRADKKTQDR